ncbi:MAG: hypothetical protein RRA94_11330 [Bacteroidota bacterium]|nr:hypothetical protein [Bacteroidota bacterium]
MGVTHHIGLEIAERSFRFVEIQQQDRQSTVLRADTLETARDYASELFFDIPFDRELARQFITDLATVYHRRTVFAGSISLVLPATLPLVFTVPVDSTLSEAERLRQLHWECTTLGNVPQETRMRMLTHVLGKEGATMRYLVVALPQALVDFLTQTCDYLTLDLTSIDIDHFAMENVLRRLYPHDVSQQYAVAGLHAGHCSVGRYADGRYLGYRMAGITYKEHYAAQVLGLIDALQPAGRDALKQLYIFGDAATTHVVDALEEILSCPVTRCIPLADTVIPGEVRAHVDGDGERVFDASAAAALMGQG